MEWKSVHIIIKICSQAEMLKLLYITIKYVFSTVYFIQNCFKYKFNINFIIPNDLPQQNYDKIIVIVLYFYNLFRVIFFFFFVMNTKII